jgi:hypothetical protein
MVLELREVSLPHAIPSCRRVDEHCLSRLGQSASLGLVTGWQQLLLARQRALHRGHAGGDTIGAQQRPDLAVTPC